MLRIYPTPSYGLGAWYNPVSWGEEAWHWITKAYDEATKVPGWVWDGSKWVYGKVTDKCTYVLGPLSWIPGVKGIFKGIFTEVASKLGPLNTCSPEGQALATVAVSAYATAHGIDPALASLISTFGVAVIIECICKRGGIDTAVNPPSGTPPDGKKSAVVPIVVAAGAAVLLIGLARR